ncbi:MAG: outer membrane protein assembly factor BamB family protein [Blastocatellia bacterium]
MTVFPLRTIRKLAVYSFALAALISTKDLAAQTADESPMPLVKCWEYHFDNVDGDVLATDENAVYVSVGRRTIRALRLRDPKLSWTTEFGGEVASNFLVLKDKVLLISNSSGGKDNGSLVSTLRFFSKDTGITTLALKLPSSQRYYLVGDNSIFFAIGEDGTITAIETKTGSIFWQRTFGSVISGEPVVAEKVIAVVIGAKQILFLSKDTGKTLFESNYPLAITAIQKNGENMLTLGDERGNVKRMHAETGDIEWSFKSGALISYLSKTKKGILAASYDNFLYLLSSFNGSVLWKRRLSGRVSGAILELGEVALVSTIGDSNLQIVSLDSGKIVNRIALGDEVFPLSPPAANGRNGMVIAVPDMLISYGLKSCPVK